MGYIFQDSNPAITLRNRFLGACTLLTNIKQNEDIVEILLFSSYYTFSFKILDTIPVLGCDVVKATKSQMCTICYGSREQKEDVTCTNIDSC